MRKVQIGQTFKKIGLKSIWEVQRLVVDQDGIRHFQLRDQKDPSRTILISERALLNTRYFEPAETVPTPGGLPTSSQ